MLHEFSMEIKPTKVKLPEPEPNYAEILKKKT